MLEGVILKGIGGFYYIAAEHGVYECRARGIFRKEGIRPTVGDAVRISVLDEEKKKGSLDEILPRRNELIRPRVANVDQAVIVFAAKSPNMNLDLLDRFLLLAEEQALDIVIVINKIDLDKKARYAQAAQRYREVGYPVICTSVEKGEGIAELRQALEHKISVFAGPSGVGKSSLLNAAFPALELNTGAISEKIQRGKHTTREVTIFEACGGLIADTPGFASLDTLKACYIPPENLEFAFPEFKPYFGECKFTGCSHRTETGCAVREALQNGELSQSRYQSYVTMYEEAQQINEWERKK